VCEREPKANDVSIEEQKKRGHRHLSFGGQARGRKKEGRKEGKMSQQPLLPLFPRCKSIKRKQETN